MLDRKKTLWNLLFNEELERQLDVNKIENVVRGKVQDEREAEEVYKMKGGILYTRLEKEIKNGVMSALQAPTLTTCGCPSCTAIRGVNVLIEFWLSLEKTLEKGKKE